MMGAERDDVNRTRLRRQPVPHGDKVCAPGSGLSGRHETKPAARRGRPQRQAAAVSEMAQPFEEVGGTVSEAIRTGPKAAPCPDSGRRETPTRARQSHPGGLQQAGTIARYLRQRVKGRTSTLDSPSQKSSPHQRLEPWAACRVFGRHRSRGARNANPRSRAVYTVALARAEARFRFLNRPADGCIPGSVPSQSRCRPPTDRVLLRQSLVGYGRAGSCARSARSRSLIQRRARVERSVPWAWAWWVSSSWSAASSRTGWPDARVGGCAPSRV